MLAINTWKFKNFIKILFTVASINSKYLVINLIKPVQSLYAKIYKTFMEIKRRFK